MASSAHRSRGGLTPTSRITDAEPSFLEMRNSLLHHIEESMGEKKHQAHRLICISKLRPEVSNANIGSHYGQLVKDIVQPEELSGLLLVYPLHCVHILEATTPSIVEYLRDLQKQNRDEDGFFCVSKILVVAHDITTPLFQNWMFHVLDIQATGIGDYESTEATENLVIDVVINIIKIGVYLSKQPKLSYNSAVQAIHEKIPESLPQQDMLEYFLDGDDSAVQPVEEFLSQYELPYNMTLQGAAGSITTSSTTIVIDGSSGIPMDAFGTKCLNTKCYKILVESAKVFVNSIS